MVFRLDITLQKTYRDILNNLTEVICDYSCPIGEDGDEDDVSIRNVLTLTAGTQVAVLDKKYDSQGWWLVHGQNQVSEMFVFVPSGSNPMFG